MSLRVEAASQINPKLELETVGSVAEHPAAEWLNSVNSSAELECLLKANSDTEQVMARRTRARTYSLLLVFTYFLPT